MRDNHYRSFFKNTLKIKPHLTVISVLLNIGIFSFAAGVATCVRMILNSLDHGVVGTGIMDKIWIYLLLMGLVALIRVGCILGSAYVDNLRSFYFENNLRANILRCVFKQKNLKDVADNSGRVFEVADDDIWPTAFPMELLTEVLGYVGYTLIAIGSLLIINWRITIFIFVPLSLAILIIKKVSVRIKANRKANRDIHEEVTLALSDTIDSIMTIKTMDSGKAVLEHYDRLNGKRKKIVLKDVLFQSMVGAGVDGAIIVCTIIMMFAVADMMRKGLFPIGDFAIFIFYLDTLADCINRIVELYTETKNSEVTYRRILNTIGSEHEVELIKQQVFSLHKKDSKLEKVKVYPEGDLDKLNEFRIENLECMYDESRGIKNLSFSLKAGELLAVTGPVGSGKSTVLNAISGIVSRKAGEVYWNGEAIEEPLEAFKAPDVVYCLQSGRLLNASIRENLTLGRDISDNECRRALKQGCFLKDVDEMPNGLNSNIGENGGKLSGGQRQRLLLSRMFLYDTKLYLLDDATSALDVETERYFWNNFIMELHKRGAAAIVVTDRQRVLAIADEVLVMK